MSTKLLFTLICDDVRFENTGKLVVVGLYNYSITFLVPSAQTQIQPGSPPKFPLPKLCLVRRWQVDSSDFVAKTSIVDPDKKVVVTLETKLAMPKDGSFYQEVIQLAGPVFTLGRYTILTTYQDEGPKQNEEFFEVRTISLPVVANQLSAVTGSTLQG